MAELPRITTDTELTQLAYKASREQANRDIQTHNNVVASGMDGAANQVRKLLGIAAESFTAHYDEPSRWVYFSLGSVCIAVRETFAYSSQYEMRLHGGACPTCGEGLLSDPIGRLSDLGSAIASLEESRITGERPGGRFFDKAVCKCTAQPVPDFDPQQDAINRLALALNDVLYMGGYPLGGQQ